MGEGEDLDLGGQEAVEGGQVKEALVAGDRHVPKSGPRALGDQLPRHQVAVVLHLGQEYHVALLQVRAAPAGRHQVDRFRGAAGEDDLLRGLGVDELPHAVAGALVAVGGAHREGVEPPVHVGVVLRIEVVEGVDHGHRLLRRRGVVQVDERVAVHLLVQYGELVADAVPGLGHRAQSMWLSVVAGALSPRRAFRAACHDRVAHLIRAGKAWTPANAPRSLMSSGSLPVVTISWNSP